MHGVDANATELDDPGIAPRRLREMNAGRKAWLVEERYPDHIELGADASVLPDDHPLGKPADLADSRRVLEEPSGRIHEVVTGVALLGAGAVCNASTWTRASTARTFPATWRL